ncbi:S1 family peptidase [Nannocystis pusilla]|uniref:S1 family peptidase n=1 Tax=Nannocystis pusilla TaxID=889268 RepID=UPI003B76FF9C
MLLHARTLFFIVGFAALGGCDEELPEGDGSPAGSIDESPDLEGLAEIADPGEAVAYEAELWLDACESQEPAHERLLEAEAMLVPVAYVHDNKDGTFAIDTVAFTATGQNALDPASLFYGQPRVPLGRSGVLVGSDLVVTAPHVENFDFASFKVVLGLASRLVDGACVQPDWTEVPDDDVFDAVQVLANTYVAGTSYPHDYALLRLDRPTGRPPLRIRRSGRAQDGDVLVQVGHPHQLSTKISPEGEVLGWDPARGLLMNGLHSLAGSSGSMIYNAEDDYLEAVVRTGGCGRFDKLPNGKYQLVPTCSPTPFAPNRPIVDVAAAFPAFSLVPHPLDQIHHSAAVNALPSALHTQYSLRAPATAKGRSSGRSYSRPRPPASRSSPFCRRSPPARWRLVRPSRSRRPRAPPASAGSTTGPSVSAI